MIKVAVKGLEQLQRTLDGMQKQVRYATSRALNNVAYKVNAELKSEMQHRFKGGATAYTLRSFKIDKSNKENLTAVISMRSDAPTGGTSYVKSLGHLFAGGTRQWKKLEGWLRGKGILPDGYMAVPGAMAPLDMRGNMKRRQLGEMTALLTAKDKRDRIGLTRWQNGKVGKDIGFFVIKPGAKSHLPPGVWRRIETGRTSAVQPYIMFVKPGNWQQFIDMRKVAERIVSAHWHKEFDKEITAALRSAR